MARDHSGTSGNLRPNMRWLVDGMNVIGTRPDGWWRDRPAAMARLADALDAFAATQAPDDAVTVVFDGRPRDLGTHPHLAEVAFAPGGRDAADDEIARRAAADADPSDLTVVTSDATLAARARAAGAAVEGSKQFRARLS
jgi:predicted RNA-binding protein with PIN domain